MSNYMPNPAHPQGLYPHELPLDSEQLALLKEIYYQKGLKYGLRKLFELVNSLAEERQVAHLFRAQVEKWLKNQEAYQLHKKADHKISETKSITAKKFGHLQIDTLVMGNMAFNGYHYIVNIIDVYSRYAWSIPMKTITAEKVHAKLSELFATMKEKPRIIQVDNGGEYSKHVSGVQYIVNKAHSPNSNALVESYNGTIRKVISSNWNSGLRNWVALLDGIVEGYNRTRHRIIKTSPYEVYVNGAVIDSPVEQKRTTVAGAQLKVGDRVRLRQDTKGKSIQKGQPTWSTSVYTIVKVRPAKGDVLEQYKLASSDGSQLKGLYNITYLQKIEGTDETPKIGNLGTGMIKRQEISEANTIDTSEMGSSNGYYLRSRTVAPVKLG